MGSSVSDDLRAGRRNDAAGGLEDEVGVSPYIRTNSWGSTAGFIAKNLHVSSKSTLEYLFQIDF